MVQHFDLLVDYQEAIAFVMEYVEQNDYLINCAYDSIGREEMKRFFCADFYHVVQSVLDRAEEEKNAKLEPDFKVFLTNFYTEALAGMLLEMVQEKDNEKRKQSMEYITKIIQTQISCLVNSLEKCKYVSFNRISLPDFNYLASFLHLCDALLEGIFTPDM